MHSLTNTVDATFGLILTLPDVRRTPTADVACMPTILAAR